MIERTPAPGYPKPSLAATKEDFMTAGNALGCNNQVGSRVFTAASRFVDRNPEYSSVNVDGRLAVPPEAIQAIDERVYIMGIGERGRAIISLLHQDILLRIDP